MLHDITNVRNAALKWEMFCYRNSISIKNATREAEKAGGSGGSSAPVSLSRPLTLSAAPAHPALERRRLIPSNRKGRKLYGEVKRDDAQGPKEKAGSSEQVWHSRDERGPAGYRPESQCKFDPPPLPSVPAILSMTFCILVRRPAARRTYVDLHIIFTNAGKQTH